MRIITRFYSVTFVLTLALILLSSSLNSPAMARLFSVPRVAVVRPHHPVVQHHHKYVRNANHTSGRRVITSNHHHKLHHRVVVAKVRHAYPLNFFMLNAPSFDRSALSAELSREVQTAFFAGSADSYPPTALVRAGIAQYCPLHGGIFFRREPVKYIILHSTETGVPQNAPRVIASWNSAGRRHPGAQYIVDRDGTIYQAVDPNLATVHVNIFKTLPGINNDNSIGIEMVHAGKQTYTPEQRLSVLQLVTYLQRRYQVISKNIITHRYAQQGDHTDPVAFDWDQFLENQRLFANQAIASKLQQMSQEAESSWLNNCPVASTYLQTHGQLPIEIKASTIKSNSSRQIVAPSNTASLRGPIAIDPIAASLINNATPITAQATDNETSKSNNPGNELEMFIH